MLEGWVDYFCFDVFFDIFGCCINFYFFKVFCIIYFFEVKKIKIEFVSKYVVQYNDVFIIIKYYDFCDFKEEKN